MGISPAFGRTGGLAALAAALSLAPSLLTPPLQASPVAVAVPLVMVASPGYAGAPAPTNPAALTPHEIPVSVMVQAYLVPEGQRLRLIVRVPLEAMRDFLFPATDRGFLDIARADPLLREAAQLWIADYLVLYEGDTRLGRPEIVAVRASLPSDRSFAAYEDALAQVLGPPLPDGTELPWQQALLDVLFEYPITSEQSEFTMNPALAHLGLQTLTVLRFRPPGGAERVLQYSGDPGLVRLDPRWYQAAFQFVKLGFFHILDGIDHLLFVLGLVIPFRRLRPLVVMVTSFTAAHSITLIGSAFGLAPNALWFPPLVETLIALSIVYMAFENIVGPRIRQRWMIAFAFGLVHGFGFSFLLRESLQFAGSHLLASLLAFNVGVEIGQLAVLVVMIPLLELLFRRVVAERMGTILLSALVAHTAWHWMTERWAQLRQYQFRWPALDLLFLASLMRWLALGLILAGAMWLLFGLFGRLLQAKPERETAGAD